MKKLVHAPVKVCISVDEFYLIIMGAMEFKADAQAPCRNLITKNNL